MIKNIVLDWHGVLDLISPMTLRSRFIKLFLKLIWRQKFLQAWHILKFGFDSYSPMVTDYAAGKVSGADFWNYVRQQTDADIAKAFHLSLMQVHVNQNLVEFLKPIQDSYNLYILSDCPLDKKPLIIDKIPSELHFKKLYFSCDYLTTKRDAKLFELFLAQENLNPAETLFIDDSFKNIKIAKTFGLQTKLFLTHKDASQLNRVLKK